MGSNEHAGSVSSEPAADKVFSQTGHPKLHRAWKTIEESCTDWATKKTAWLSLALLAVSDGNDDVPALQANTFRSPSFRRKFSEKSLGKPASLNTQQLYEEYNNLLVEYGNLKHLVEQVKGEYECTKDFDFFKRYTKIKGVIKRCLTYMEIGILPDAPAIASGLIAAAGAVTPNRFARRYSSSATVDLTKTELTERTDSVKRSISLLRSQIQIMAEKYESSKQFMVFQRYRLMKAMVKELVRDSARY